MLVALLALIAVSSCDLVDRDEPSPAWITIDSMAMVDNPNVDEGALSQDISDAWVFIDDELIGIFELPADIPVLDEGKHKLLVGPGIKVSTVSTLRDNYLFYNAHQQDVTLTPGEKVSITPTISYRDEGNNFKYIVVEEFEDAFIELNPNDNTDAEIKRTTDGEYVKYGFGAGLIEITDTTKAAWIRTSEDFVLPQLGKIVYLEVDYYTQYELVVGIHINQNVLADQNVNYLVLKASQSEEVEWKKAYVALTSVLSEPADMESVYLYFLPDIQSSNRESGIVLLDNIKILYQQ
ncbi:MAG: hypothetical protein HQ500_07305 [Flavobacteriales bacterium]|nr:hypothetical protein [Flavobacteriales bacterium]